MKNAILKLTLLATLVLTPLASAMAEGASVPWEIGMQEAASSSSEHLHSFHNFMMYIITAITLFVMVLLLYVIVRFNKRANPVPKQFSHNVTIEVLWTVIPVLILIVIAIPSFKMLYFLDRTAKPEMTLKVTGFQWYWGYEYPDQDGINFQSYMVPTKDLKDGEKRLLTTDNKVYLPVDTDIQILVTASDVIHSWAVPALGVKMDAVPGRLNETWVHITKPGVYYGQCSELCGKDHSFMPIEIHAVPKEEFQQWVVKAKEQFSMNILTEPAVKLASIQ